MADLADDLWCGMNERHSGAKSQDSNELEEAVATLNMQPKKKKATKPGKPPGKLCQGWESGPPFPPMVKLELIVFKVKYSEPFMCSVV